MSFFSMPLSEKGVSLVSAIIGMGLVGALALGVAEIGKQSGQTQIRANSNADEVELKAVLRNLLNDSKQCSLSIAGRTSDESMAQDIDGSFLHEGDYMFLKTNIDEPEDGEGMNVEIFYGNQNGNQRTKKVLSSTDSQASKFGNLEISSMKLVMNNGAGSNYSASARHRDTGEIIVKYNKRTGNGGGIDKLVRFPLSLALSTDASGETKILSCRNNFNPELEELACKMANKFYDPTQSPSCRNVIYASNFELGGWMTSYERSFEPQNLECPSGMAVSGIKFDIAIHHTLELATDNPTGVVNLGIFCREINYESSNNPKNLTAFGPKILINDTRIIPASNMKSSNPSGPVSGSDFDNKNDIVECPDDTFAFGIKAEYTENQGIKKLGLSCRGNGSIRTAFPKGITGGDRNQTRACSNQGGLLRQLTYYKYSRAVSFIRGNCW